MLVESSFSEVLAPKTAMTVEVEQGQRLRITDLEGKQVVDLVIFNRANFREKLSTANSRNRYIPPPEIRYQPRDHLEAGDYLMSTLCRPLMRFVGETATPKGVHDACNRMCNSFMYQVAGAGPRNGCQENLASAISSYGLGAEDIPDPFNVFMNFKHDCSRRTFDIWEPVTNPGDYVDFEALMDCLVGMSNCPDDVVTRCNGGRCTPMKVEVFHDPHHVRFPVLPPDEWLKDEMAMHRMPASTVKEPAPGEE